MKRNITKADVSRIRGTDGLDVFLRDGVFFVEHFSLATDPTKIVARFGPYADRNHAYAALRVYRQLSE